jgi:hypothetical protein
VEPAKADTDVRREMQQRVDMLSAVKLQDVVVHALKAGADPKYVAHKFGVSLERCERYVAAVAKQKEAQARSHQARYEPGDVGNRGVLLEGGAAESEGDSETVVSGA